MAMALLSPHFCAMMMWLEIILRRPNENPYSVDTRLGEKVPLIHHQLNETSTAVQREGGGVTKQNRFKIFEFNASRYDCR